MKYKQRVVFGLLAISICLQSCNDTEQFCGDNKSKGIIEEDIFFDCIGMNDMPDQSWVIQDQEFLDSLYLEKCDKEEGSVPHFDFETYSLLGVYADAGGCEATFIREVTRDEDAKKYLYTIEIKECGLCDMSIFSMNWVLVPRVPEDWMVEFYVSYR